MKLYYQFLNYRNTKRNGFPWKDFCLQNEVDKEGCGVYLVSSTSFCDVKTVFSLVDCVAALLILTALKSLVCFIFRILL